jgi:cellulose synthase/poly-beta-1,6-N-acetylglucosamine synthase-like glycosyltransferase
MIVEHILTILVFVYLLCTLGYLFVLAAAGRFGRIRKYEIHPDKARIAVLIPSYKEDNIILETARQALLQDYPKDKYEVTVIADHLLPETVKKLRELPIRVLEPILEKSMKARSLHAAFGQIPAEEMDMALVLDADNVMAPGCLEKVNDAWQKGWKVIQCHRTAKNKNTSVAVLDALSEEANNTMFRKGQRVLGLSCALIGSGMAFQYALLKEIFSLPAILDNPGEDREVDIQLVKRKIVVEYIEDAYVYDEKVQRKEVFEKQRTRWLGTQVDHLKRFLSADMRGLSGNRIYLHKLFQCIFLPRLLLMFVFFLAFAGCGLDLLLRGDLMAPYWPWWVGLAVLYGATMLTAIPSTFYNRATVRALLKVPALIFSMIRALLGMKKNRSGFLHTPKEFT